MENKDLLEPCKLYSSSLKQSHHERVEKYFNELKNLSGVDISANKETCSKYYSKENELKKISKKIAGRHSLKIFLIVLAIIGGLLILFGALGLAFANNQVIGIPLLIVGICLTIGSLLIIFLVVRPGTKKLEAACRKLEEECQKLMDEAYSQMASLNSLFDSEVPAKLFEETCPLLDLDRTFTKQRYECLLNKYGYRGVGDSHHSVLGVISGSILGNPFCLVKEKKEEMRPHTYIGTLVITWTSRVSNGKGGSYTVTHTQTLTAEVIKPRPEYDDTLTLIYGNEAAPNLEFSRQMSNISSMNDKEIARYVSKHEKDLTKMSEKAMKKGGTYTPLGNAEFELFFGGLDRNNEVEYRLLFTPLGQKSMLDLMKSKDGYGDDFNFRKMKMINKVRSVHSQCFDYFVDESYFTHFDFEVIQKRFIEYNDTYFKSLFFDFAPLLAIPLYQQHKSHEYIYKDTIKSNITEIEHEVIANKYNPTYFAHKDTSTQVILKTEFVKDYNGADIVRVVAHSFKEIPHIEVVPKLGGDGRMHGVPVTWYEYQPLKNSKDIEILDLNVSILDYNKKKPSDEALRVFSRGLYSEALGANKLNIDVNSLKEKMHK